MGGAPAATSRKQASLQTINQPKLQPPSYHPPACLLLSPLLLPPLLLLPLLLLCCPSAGPCPAGLQWAALYLGLEVPSQCIAAWLPPAPPAAHDTAVDRTRACMFRSVHGVNGTVGNCHIVHNFPCNCSCMSCTHVYRVHLPVLHRVLLGQALSTHLCLP